MAIHSLVPMGHRPYGICEKCLPARKEEAGRILYGIVERQYR
jgi:hypothetical protein